MMKRNQMLPIVTILILMASTISSSALPHRNHPNKAVKGVYWFQGSIPVASIDASLFTHLFCAFASIDDDTNHVTISDSDASSFSTFTSSLQLRNPQIKTLLSVGGGGSNATTFADMTASPAARRAFINSSISVARSFNFHGLDLDYEFPTSVADMNNLADFLSDWRSAVSAESMATGKPTLLLTAAVYYSAVYHSLPLPAKAMGQYLDWINVMAYDFWAPAWSTLTRPTSALYDTTSVVSGSNGVCCGSGSNDPTSVVSGSNDPTSVVSGSNAWLNAGVPAKKVVLGFPFYGRAWKLANAADHGYLAVTDGAMDGTDNGALSFRQIKEFVANNTGAVTTVYNATTAESYSYVGTTWISYNDMDAIAAKMRFVRSKGLRGYFAWHVGGDDEQFTLAKTAARFSC